jgi:membrane-associated protease RseP (regulator of RpoE activity)
MRLSPLFTFAALALAVPALRAEDTPKEQPEVMAPYAVNETPLGFLGVRHATVGINPFKWIVGMNSVTLLQIDELDPLSPGIAAGVKAGDRISSIDGVPITHFGIQKLRRMGDEATVGQKFIVGVTRPSDGSTRTMVIIVARRPKPPGGP